MSRSLVSLHIQLCPSPYPSSQRICNKHLIIKKGQEPISFHATYPLVSLGPKQTSPARSDQGAPRLLGIEAALDHVFAGQRRHMQQRG